MKTDEITILFVSYNSDKILLKNITKLKNFKIIIIDNFINNKLSTKIKDFKNIKYLKNIKNLGEGEAASFGLNFVQTKFTLYLNPDTLIDEANILQLNNVFLDYDNIGLVSPLHLDINMNFLGNYFAHPFTQRINRTKLEKLIFNKLDKVKPVGDLFVKSLWGAPLFFKTDFIKNIGFYDKNFFLYFEDVDLCDRVIQNKLRVVLTPSAFCYHLHEDLSSKSLSYLYFTSSNFIFSQIYYFKKNNKKIWKFYLRFFEYFINSIIYLLKFNKNKSFKNIFRICGIFKYFLFSLLKS